MNRESGSAAILVAGAINTDLVATMERTPAAGETVSGTSFSIHGGGKGANQAVAVARTGGSVSLLGAIGNDDFGRARLADLRQDGVGVDWVLRTDQAQSGVALILVEATGENRIAYVPGATRSVTPDLSQAAFEAVRPAFILAPNELPKACLRELFRTARAVGATVVLNATPDPEVARDLLGDTSILVINEVEAASLLGTSGVVHPPDAVLRLRDAGPGTVIVTLGVDGACASDGQDMVWHRPPQVEVVDTTGAGDTFCGALVTELARGVSLGEAVRFGVYAGALSVAKPGAQSSIPGRTEIERSLAAV